jgi:hypothetical protein
MTENNTPIADEPNDETKVADDLFSPTETSSPVSSPSVTKPNKWLIPGAAAAGVALLSGLLGFSIGSHSGPDFRPAAVAGQMVPGQGAPGMGAPGMAGDHDGDMEGKQKGKGMHGKPGQPGMMPGSPQGDSGPKTPHCHDATGTDVEAGADGLCEDGALPGMRGMGGNLPSPAPSASSSSAVQ